MDGAPEVVVETVGVGGGGEKAVLSRVLWLGLLAAGIAAAFKRASNTAVRNVLLLTTASQFLLHMNFADDPFLFAAHFTPLMVLIAAHAVLFRRPVWAVRAVGTLLVVLVGYNNFVAFDRMTDRLDRDALSWLERHGTPISAPDPRTGKR
jgi:hypothetical protein